MDLCVSLQKPEALRKLDVKGEGSFDSYKDEVRKSAAEKYRCVERSNHSQSLEETPLVRLEATVTLR